MLRLDTTTRKLQALLGGAITTNQLPITVCYSDKTATAYTGGTTVINTNNTTAVDICAAPAASTVRDVDTINVNNADTVAATITIRYNDNGTTYTLFKATLAVGDQLTYVHGVGWNVIDSTGKTKVGAGVNGPSSSTDNALVRWDGTAGTAVQNSGWTLSDTDALNGVSGSVGAPSLTLNSETTSGLYRIGSNNHGWSISGAKVLDISSTGLGVTGAISGSATISTSGAIASFTDADAIKFGFSGSVGTVAATRTGGNYSTLAFATSGADGNGVTRLTLGTDGAATFAVGGTTRAVVNSTGLSVSGTLTATGAGEVASPLVVTGTNLGAAGSVWFGSDANGGGAINVPTGEVFLGLVNQAEVLRYSSTGVAVTGAGNFTGNLTVATNVVSLSASAGANAMTLDASGNLGIGVTPSAWDGAALQMNTNAALFGFANTTNLVQNAYYGSGWKYISTAAAAIAQVAQGTHYWFTAPSGTAGNTITFTERMKLTEAGSFTLATAGPHAIGGATYSGAQLNLSGTFASASDPSAALRVVTAVDVLANTGGYTVEVGGTLNKAGSGTHSDFVSLRVNAPTIGAGAATLTNASTLKITGAPTGASNNYALWVDAGTIRFDGTTGAGANTGTLTNAPSTGDPAYWMPVNANGTTYYIPCWT